MKIERQFTFDVASSYAGEDREAVEAVLLELAKLNVRVFYDREATAVLWGTNLIESLGEIYTIRSRFFVPFISKNYVSKVWPKFEFKSALQRVLESNDTFILPIRLDDAPFELLNTTVHYLNYREMTAAQIASAVLTKLGFGQSAPYEPGRSRTDSVIVSSWDFAHDQRVLRHASLLASQYPFWANAPRLSALLTTTRHLPIQQDRLNATFLDTRIRYAEGYNHATRIRSHAKGFTREFPSHRREKGETPLEAWTCYQDGLIAYDAIIDTEIDGRTLLNLNALAYDALRVRQLSNEVFDTSDQNLDLVLDLKNIGDVGLPEFVYNTIGAVHQYGGYHEPIELRIPRSEISDRSHWNRVCDPIEDILIAVARVFGLDGLPQAYWDRDGILEYSKVGGRR